MILHCNELITVTLLMIIILITLTNQFYNKTDKVLHDSLINNIIQ